MIVLIKLYFSSNNKLKTFFLIVKNFSASKAYKLTSVKHL